MASEWSSPSRLNPLIAVSIEITTYDWYGAQVRLSALSLKPVAQAQENRPPGRGRHSCSHAPTLLLQPFDSPAEARKRRYETHGAYVCLLKYYRNSLFLKWSISVLKPPSHLCWPGLCWTKECVWYPSRTCPLIKQWRQLNLLFTMFEFTSIPYNAYTNEDLSHSHDKMNIGFE